MRDDRDAAESIFQEACDLPEAQRAPYVAARCGDNGPLRREVEALLEHERVAPAAFLTGPPADAPPPLDEVGPRVGPYRIVRRIGEGGFGSVYLGEQESPIRRQVAIKVVKLGMDTRQIVRRFEAERRTLALMSHAHIARVIDAGVTERGRPYFVMEHVPGPPITEYCDTHRLDIPGRLGLFLDACAAIEHAHHKGVIHRDIKPSNILVDTVDGHAAVKVIDFGIAKALGETRAEHTAATEPGQFVGTPEYVSPEQAVPGGDVDTRSDIYSLGVLLYRLVCGAMPSDGATGGASSGLARPSAPVAPPSGRVRLMGGEAAGIAERRGTDARALARRLRGDLDWITLKAMDPDRARRYSSCSELAADIRRHLDGQAVMAGPPSAGYRLRKFVSRHRAGVAGAASALLVLVIGVAGTAWQAVRATRAETAARNDRDAARLETRRAEAVRTFLTDMLADAQPTRGGDADLSVREAVDRAAARLDAGALKEHPEVEDAVRDALGRTYRALRVNASVVTQFEWIVAYRERAHGPASRTLADGLAWLASSYGSAGRVDEAVAAHERAISIYRLKGPGSLAEVDCLIDLAAIAVTQGDTARVIEILTPVVERLERSDRPGNSGRLGMAYLRLAQALCRAGRRDEGAAAYARSQPLIEQATGPLAEERHRFVGAYCTDVLLPSGRAAEAAALLGASVDAIRGPYGPDHATTLTNQLLLGRALTEAGRAAEAEPILRENLAVRERTLPANTLSVFVARSDLGHALAVLGRDAEAEPMLVQAFEGIDSHHPTRRAERARALERVITFYERLARPEQAETYRSRAD
ncbi:MAG: protein kinase domain-containing protein [Phycisphaerales bacterium]